MMGARAGRWDEAAPHPNVRGRPAAPTHQHAPTLYPNATAPPHTTTPNGQRVVGAAGTAGRQRCAGAYAAQSHTACVLSARAGRRDEGGGQAGGGAAAGGKVGEMLVIMHINCVGVSCRVSCRERQAGVETAAASSVDWHCKLRCSLSATRLNSGEEAAAAADGWCPTGGAACGASWQCGKQGRCEEGVSALSMAGHETTGFGTNHRRAKTHTLPPLPTARFTACLPHPTCCSTLPSHRYPPLSCPGAADSTPSLPPFVVAAGSAGPAVLLAVGSALLRGHMLEERPRGASSLHGARRGQRALPASCE